MSERNTGQSPCDKLPKLLTGAMTMATEQDWHTEFHNGMNVHVTALPRDASHTSWDFSVRVAQPGEDTSAEAELTAKSGDDDDFPTKEAAIEAGFRKGYEIVDSLAT